MVNITEKIKELGTSSHFTLLSLPGIQDRGGDGEDSKWDFFLFSDGSGLLICYRKQGYQYGQFELNVCITC